MVARTIDGRATLGIERVVEKFTVQRSVEQFWLSRGPLNFDPLTGDPLIHMIVVDDEVLTLADVEVIDGDGMIGLVDDGHPYAAAGEIIIEYTAGYNLPYAQTPVDGAPAMPSPIEEAIFCLLKGMASSERADPSIRSESSEEVDSFTYFAEGGMTMAWREAHKKLSPYRRLFQ